MIDNERKWLETERALAIVVAGITNGLLQAASIRIGDDADLSQLSPEWWETARRQSEARLYPILYATQLESFSLTASELQLSMPFGTVLQAVDKGAKLQAKELAATILGTLNENLMELSNDVRAGRLTIAAYLAGVWPPNYEELVAVTETTNAVTAGNNAMVEAARERIRRFRERTGGVIPITPPAAPPTVPPQLPGRPTPRIVRTWITALDDRVCAICGPLHGTTEEVWGKQFPEGPAAHPFCRCRIANELRMD